MKARFTEQQPAVRWQPLPDGKVDVTICLHGEKVTEKMEQSQQGGDIGGVTPSEPKETESSLQEYWEYDFHQFREHIEKISKEEIENDPESFLTYTPQPDETGGGNKELEKKVAEVEKQINSLTEAIERGMTI